MVKLMHKIIATIFFIFGLSVLGFPQENITITTYYPSPYGSYVELRAQQMAIGATYYNRTSVCWGAGCPGGSVDPTAATDLVVEGRVGIGTRNPSTALEINGAGVLNRGLLYVNGIFNDGFIVVDTNQGATRRSGIGWNNGSPTIQWYAYMPAGSTDLRFISTGDMVTFQRSGNVGIGTTTPQNRLDVEGSAVIGAAYSGTNAAPADGLLVQGRVGLGTTTPQNPLDVEGSAVIGATYSGTNTAPANGLLVEGNVGIGTTNPNIFKLQVVGQSYLYGSSGSNAALIESGASGGTAVYGYATSATGQTRGVYGRINAANPSAWAGYFEGRGYFSGNVGIGITNPTAKLDVAGGIAMSAGNWLMAKDAAGTNYGLIGSGGSGQPIGIGSQTAFFGGIRFYPGVGDSIFMYNNVGIGTTTPAGTLDVNGTIYQRGVAIHADYVFEPGYQLESIEKHAQYMWQYKHLQAVPSLKHTKDGQEIVEIGANSRGILEELEKAHIYIQQLNAKIKSLEVKLAVLEGKKR